MRNFISDEKQSHSAKNAKREAFGFFIIQLVAEIQNNQRGDPLATSKILQVSMPKKTVKPSELKKVKMGDPFALEWFCNSR